MRVLEDGHKYELDNFESNTKQVIQFVHKEDDLDGATITVCDGTTNEELLLTLINRIKYLQCKCSCKENDLALIKLEEALMWLNQRTKNNALSSVKSRNLL